MKVDTPPANAVTNFKIWGDGAVQVSTTLMVTGAYFPELSGGGLQCKAIVDALRDQVHFTVLTTCTEPSLPEHDQVNGGRA